MASLPAFLAPVSLFHRLKPPTAAVSRRPHRRRRQLPAACAEPPTPHPMHATGIPKFANEPPKEPITESQLSKWLAEATDGPSAVRLRAVMSCRHLSPSAAAPILHAAYDAGETELQNRGFLALFFGYKPTARSFDILSEIVENDDTDEVRANAVAALGYLRDRRAVPMCLGFLRKGHWSVRTAAAVTLGMIAEAHPDLRSIVYDDVVDALQGANGDWGLITACLGALGDLRDVRAVDIVKEFLNAEDFSVAQCAVEALGKMPCGKSMAILREIVDKDVHVNVLWAAEIGIKAVEESLKKEDR